MADQTGSGSSRNGTSGGTEAEAQVPPHDHDKLTRKPEGPGRDDRLDAELEAERREPGLRTGGKGETGAAADHPRDHDNSNT